MENVKSARVVEKH